MNWLAVKREVSKEGRNSPIYSGWGGVREGLLQLLMPCFLVTTAPRRKGDRQPIFFKKERR